MFASGSQPDRTEGQCFASDNFFYRQRRLGTEPLSEKAGKHLGHVLHHHDRHRKVLRNTRQQFRQCVRSAGRNANVNNCNLTFRGPRQAPARRQRLGMDPALPAKAPQTQRVDFGKQVAAQIFHRRGQSQRIPLLGNIIVGAQGQRIQSGRGATVGERAEHDDGQMTVGPAYFSDCGQSVHHRHLDIHHNQVGSEFRDALQGGTPLRSGTGDFQLRISRDQIRQNATDDRRIVHQQNAEFGAGSGHQQPSLSRIASFSCSTSQVKGFMTNSLAPADNACSISSASSSAFTTLPLTPPSAFSPPTPPTNSSPFITGMFQSTSATLISGTSSTHFSASLPFPASTIS